MDSYSIVKISYNTGSTQVIGGICGSCFFVSNKKAITAHHILNNSKYPIDSDYDNTQYFVLSKNGQCFPMDYSVVINCLPIIDTTVISFQNKVKPQYIFNVRKEFESLKNENISCEGYEAGKMPQFNNPHFSNGKFCFDRFSISNYMNKTQGCVKECFYSDIQGNDVKFNSIPCLKASFGGIVGMSGAPFLDSNNRVVALASYGLPMDTIIKNFIVGVSIVEILSEVKELSFI